MTLQWVAKSISNFKPANFMHVRTGAHSLVCRKKKPLANVSRQGASPWRYGFFLVLVVKTKQVGFSIL